MFIPGRGLYLLALVFFFKKSELGGLQTRLEALYMYYTQRKVLHYDQV